MLRASTLLLALASPAFADLRINELMELCQSDRDDFRSQCVVYGHGFAAGLSVNGCPDIVKNPAIGMVLLRASQGLKKMPPEDNYEARYFAELVFKNYCD